MQSLSIHEYQIGIICALPDELKAIRAILDEEHAPLKSKDGRDHNSYVLGRVGEHNVVAAGLPAGVYGTTSAASVCKDMLRTFSELRFGLLVGIAGGIPDIPAGQDIRLGDVIVSKPEKTHCGVVQYDLGKRLPNGQFMRTGTLNKAPQTLLAALTSLRSSLDDDLLGQCLKKVEERHPHLTQEGYRYQGIHQDQLRCTTCDPSQWWWILWVLITWFWPLWRCERCVQGQVIRPQRNNTRPIVHYGLIASGNTLLKDATERDQLARDFGALGVEMEAAGLDDYPCLVIRGVCDYADAQKNDVWQKFAALTAAAFAKVLLGYVSPQTAKDERPIQQVLNTLENHLQRQETRYQNDKERDCHRALKTSNYEEYKDNNPERASDTCQWLLGHEQYLRWQRNRHSDLLWISADPGCGKSVLAKALVDRDLRSDGGDLDVGVCYFFFKDNDEQDSLATALSAVLHQLLSHQPRLIQHALPSWEKVGTKIAAEANELWRIFQAAMADPHAQRLVCVLDALDECRDADRRRLISMLCQFYNDITRTSPANGKLKFLVTSRPYEDIEYHFGRIAASLPSIRLRGEDENDSIRDEINSVVRARVQEIVRDFPKVAPRTVERLQQKLLAMDHRTYLWLHLAIDNVRDVITNSLRPDQASLELLPESVNQAYEQILCKVNQKQTTQVRTILQVVVGARRPLTLSEMALALDVATSETILRSFSDFSVDETHLQLRIRHWCGLFVFVNHSRLYLIHQTAKEFLIRDRQQIWIDSGKWKWKHCFTMADVDYKMAQIFILYLCLQDFDGEEHTTGDVTRRSGRSRRTKYQDTRSSHVSQQTDYRQELFDLAAASWADHWRSVEAMADDDIADKAWTLYNIQSQRFSRWTEVQWQTQRSYEGNPNMNNLIQAAYNGHVNIVRRILDDNNLQGIELRDGSGQTALARGAEMGHYNVVTLLLDRGAEVNARGGDYGSALQTASAGGHEQVVQLLLDRGAEVNAQRGDYGSALQVASRGGHEQVVQLLLKKGAEVNVRGGHYGSALQAASEGGHEQVVQLLLDAGAVLDSVA